MENNRLIEVVAGVLYNDQGAFLLSSRPEGKSYAGYWEFAGGKVEPGETLLTALQREFMEELGIQIHTASIWLTRVHAYEHAQVHLHFFRIQSNQWSGTLCAQENQQWHWQLANNITVKPLLPANQPILAALAIPTQFRGSLAQGFTSISNQQPCWRLWPYQPNKSTSPLPYLSAEVFKQLAPANRPATCWIVGHVQPADWVNQAQAIIWPLYSPADATALQSILDAGSPLPIMLLTTAKTINHDGQYWYCQGVHGFIEDTLVLPQTTK